MAPSLAFFSAQRRPSYAATLRSGSSLPQLFRTTQTNAPCSMPVSQSIIHPSAHYNCGGRLQCWKRCHERPYLKTCHPSASCLMTSSEITCHQVRIRLCCRAHVLRPAPNPSRMQKFTPHAPVYTLPAQNLAGSYPLTLHWSCSNASMEGSLFPNWTSAATQRHVVPRHARDATRRI